MNSIAKYVNPARKAVAAFLIPVIPAIGIIIASDSASITGDEWLLLATAAATGLGVYGISNIED